MGPRNKGGNTVSIMNDGVHGDCSTGNLFESKFWLNFKSKAKGKVKKKDCDCDKAMGKYDRRISIPIINE